MDAPLGLRGRRQGRSDSDVRASGAHGRVTHHASIVELLELQRLDGGRGDASSRRALFFTDSEYASSAVAYASQNGIALFVYSTDGSVTAVNTVARRISRGWVLRGRETMTAILYDDARTAWAYRQYIAQREPGVIGHGLGGKILEAIEPGDHVELFADAAVSKQRDLWHALQLTRTGTAEFLVVRTMRSLMFCDRKFGSVEVLTDCATVGRSAFTSNSTTWPNIGWATEATSRHGHTVAFKIFLD